MRWRCLLPALLLAGSSIAAAQTETADAGPRVPVAGAPEIEAQDRDEKRAEARISDLRLAFDGPQVRLSFKLTDALDEDKRRRVLSGLPTDFTFYFELVRARKRWFNTSVDESTLQVTAMFNAVTREYLINTKHNGHLVESHVVKDMAELEAAMTSFTDIPAFTIESKNARQRLRVRLRAKLRDRTILFFIPSTVHTDWAETRKFRLSEEQE